MADKNFTLKTSATPLAGMVVSASARLNETRLNALDRQLRADNIVSILSGDEIRALPNANAAEAVARMPGVSTERDEGEGKFVQIRGTEPRLSNVTVDGVHIPGTEQGDRIAKLDDVPSDLLAAVEVSKTLTADMDADAIGGTVNLVTKTPEGAPRGYIALQGGQTQLLNHRQGQVGFGYGGRFGQDGRLGFLIGGSADRNDRVINDLEGSWNVDNNNRSYPIEWDQRDYGYDRTRYGRGVTWIITSPTAPLCSCAACGVSSIIMARATDSISRPAEIRRKSRRPQAASVPAPSWFGKCNTERHKSSCTALPQVPPRRLAR